MKFSFPLKTLVLFHIVLVHFFAFSQEICNDALDNDNDGLVDLNDPDCNCQTITTTAPSILDNPSFNDNSNGCPIAYGWTHVDNWTTISGGSPEYFNNQCPGFMSSADWNPPPQPLPDGDGFMGFGRAQFTSGNFREDLAQCLSSSLTPNTTYTIEFNMVSAIHSTTGDTSLLNPIISVYGDFDCDTLNSYYAAQSCPTNIGWIPLVSQTISINASNWTTVSFTFTTPNIVINGIIVGFPCGPANAYGASLSDGSPADYYYIDGVPMTVTPPTSTITASGSFCNDTRVFHLNSTTGTGITNHQWYRNGEALLGETTDTLNMTGLPFGDTYSLLTTYASGVCSESNSLIASPPLPSSANAGTDQNVCFLIDTAILNGNTPTFGTGSWTQISGPTTATIVNLNSPSSVIRDLSNSGDYTFVWSLPGNTFVCPGTDTIIVTVGAPGNASFSYRDTTFCQDEVDPAPTINGITGGVFSASPTGLIIAPDGTIDLSTSMTGIRYTVTYSISGTCNFSDSVYVTINAVDNPSFGYPNGLVYCESDSNPQAVITGTTGGVFSSSVGLSLDPATGLIDLDACTANSYWVKYTTTGVCPKADSVIITINPLDNASFGYPNTTFCVNDSDPFALITGVSGGLFSSPFGLVIDPSSGLIDLDVSPSGTHLITYSTNGTCTNSSSLSITIIVLENPSFGYPNVTYCPTDANPSPTVTGDPGGTFTSSPFGLSLNPTSGEVDLGLSNAGSYIVTYTTSGSCPETMDVNIDILPSLSPDWNLLGPICENGGVVDMDLLVAGDSGGIWSGNSINGSLFDPTGLTGTIPIVYTVGSVGCSWSQMQNILIHNLDISMNVDDPEGCQTHCVEFFTDSINITGNIISYDWYTNGTNSSDSSWAHCFDQTGLYDVSLSIVDNAGCSASFSEVGMVEVFTTPIAEIGIERSTITTAESPIELFNQSWGEDYFSWTLPEGLNSIDAPLLYPINTPGEYEFYLSVETSFGCIDSTSVLVTVDPLESIFVPNAITPNGDGINDVFQVFTNDVTVNELIIFNRWGEVIFQSYETNTIIIWDPKSNGSVQDGNYTWKVIYSDFNGITKNEMGHVTVLSGEN